MTAAQMKTIADPRSVPDDAPILAGVGIATQREEDPLKAVEPLALMMRAVREAGRDSGSEDNLRHVGRISIPKGRWDYGDPGRLIAREIGAPRVASQLAVPGVLQQTLIGDACRAVAAGEVRAALVVGGEAGYRILRAKKTGQPIADTEEGGSPDEVLRPDAPLRSPAELAAGFGMPVGLYAMLDSALRTARGESLEQQRQRIGRLYEGFSAVAAANPNAWRRQALTAQEIVTPGPGNGMQATPYTKSLCSNWSVDQAAALLVMTAGLARELGVAPEKWVYALGSAESNHMETVASRRVLHRSPGARAAGMAVLETSGVAIGDVDLLDLYSCFPVAPEIVADELGIPRDRPLTITGGMAFAGGPYNNYVLQSTAEMALRLRKQGVGTGLVGCISGVVTKQAFGLWSARPPSRPFACTDVTADVARDAAPLPEAESYDGEARVVAWTVLHSSDAPPRAIVIADTPDGRRCVAENADQAFVSGLGRRDIAGEMVTVVKNNFSDSRT